MSYYPPMTNRQTKLLAAIRNGCQVKNGYDSANLIGGLNSRGASILYSLRDAGLIERGEDFFFVAVVS